jgi:hypothetical protein
VPSSSLPLQRADWLDEIVAGDVLNGVAGALFGPAQPGGTFNYVVKRPKGLQWSETGF